MLRRAFLISTALVGVAALLLLPDALNAVWSDFFRSRAMAIQALVLYWAVFNLGVCIFVTFRRKWRQLLLAAGVMILMLGFCELLLRIVLPHLAVPEFAHRASPELHHLPPRNVKTHWGTSQGEHIYVQTNEDGFRSRYDRDAFLGHQPRIVMLGDSFTFGWGVPDEKAFPVLVEQQLREHTGNPDLAVLNAGVTSFSPFLQDVLLRQIVRHYRPQLVVLFLDCSDIGDDWKYAVEANNNNGPEGQFSGDRPQGVRYCGALWRLTKPARRHPALRTPWQVVRRHWSRLQPYDYYEFHLEINEQIETNRFFIYRHPLEVTRKYFDATMKNIQRIAEQCKRLQSEFVLIVTPRFHHWNSGECPGNWERTYRLDEPHQYEYFRYFKQQSDKVDFPIRSLLSDFQSTTRFPLVFPDDPHWNQEGHRFVAEVIAKYFVGNSAILAGTQPD